MMIFEEAGVLGNQSALLRIFNVALERDKPFSMRLFEWLKNHRQQDDITFGAVGRRAEYSHDSARDVFQGVPQMFSGLAIGTVPTAGPPMMTSSGCISTFRFPCSIK